MGRKDTRLWHPVRETRPASRRQALFPWSVVRIREATEVLTDTRGRTCRFKTEAGAGVRAARANENDQVLELAVTRVRRARSGESLASIYQQERGDPFLPALLAADEIVLADAYLATLDGVNSPSVN